MPQRYFLLFVLISAMAVVRGQPVVPRQDTAIGSNSAGFKADSLPTDAHRALKADLFYPRISTPCIYGPSIGGYLVMHPWFRLDIPVRSWLISPRQRTSSDWIFYLFTCCLLYVGIIRLVFPRYMENLFRVFRNVVHRQKQLRDQVAQNALPSLLLNLFFCISGGIFLFFLWRPYLTQVNWLPQTAIISLTLLLIAIGLSKYLLLLLAGWLSGRQKEAASYLFIVFMVNKVGGILLLPISLMLAYRMDADRALWVDLAWFLVGTLFLIRLFRAYDFVSKALKINILHFIFVVFSFEILPIMLIGKALGDLFL
jgi:MFS family permease